MTEGRHYLDHNATTPLLPSAREAIAAALDVLGNPSSVHAEGRHARALIERERERVAASVGADPADVIFTSGATEANATIIAHAAQAGWPVFASAVEHLSVLDTEPAPEPLAVTSDGIIDPETLRNYLPAEGPFLLCLMLANNETGVIQPVRKVADLVHERGGYLHVDAVQALGKIPVDISEIAADTLSVSGHKIGGPAGVGALARRAGAYEPRPLIRGGGQERRLRGGTENVGGIAGLGAAAAQVVQRLADMPRISSLRDWLQDEICTISPDVTIFGAATPRLGNTLCFALADVTAEMAMIRFDLAGIAIGSGSACSSGKMAASHVLAAMGADADAAGSALRISLGPETTEADVEAAARVWREDCGDETKQTFGCGLTGRVTF